MRTTIYIGFSFFEFFISIMLKIACVIGLFFTVPHYKENPVVIVIVSALLLLFIVFVGDDRIIVYQDRIIQKTNSLYSLIFKERGTTYYISDIKVAYLEEVPKSSPVDIGVGVLLAALLPKRNSSSKSIPIFFNLKNGETVKFDSDLENKKLMKIVELVNSMATKK